MSGIDLRVPTLKISLKYRTSGSSTGNTSVQWEDRFYGNIVFVPWTEFEEKVSVTIAAVQKLHFLELC